MQKTRKVRCRRFSNPFIARAPGAKFCPECGPIRSREVARAFYWKKKREAEAWKEIPTLPKGAKRAVKQNKKPYVFNGCTVIEIDGGRCKEFPGCRKSRSCFDLAASLDLSGWVKL